MCTIIFHFVRYYFLRVHTNIRPPPAVRTSRSLPVSYHLFAASQSKKYRSLTLDDCLLSSIDSNGPWPDVGLYLNWCRHHLRDLLSFDATRPSLFSLVFSMLLHSYDISG